MRGKTYTLALLISILCSNIAFAEPEGPNDEGFGSFLEHEGKEHNNKGREEKVKQFQEQRAKLQNMSADEKIAFFDEKRKARLQKMEEKFNSMTDQDKIEFVNNRFKRMKEKMDSRWNSMSKDEKLSFIEERMSKRGERGPRRRMKEGRGE